MDQEDHKTVMITVVSLSLMNSTKIQVEFLWCPTLLDKREGLNCCSIER
jgi:hypothetical protein